MPSITAVIEKVTVKQVGQDNKDRFSIRADGKWITTFKKDEAEVAKALTDKKAILEYVEKVNGEYVNLNLVSIRPAEETTAAPQSFAATPDDRQTSIQRQTALKAAVEFAKLAGDKATVDGVIFAAEAFNSWMSGGAAAAQGQSEGNALDSDIPFAPTVN